MYQKQQKRAKKLHMGRKNDNEIEKKATRILNEQLDAHDMQSYERNIRVESIDRSIEGS